MTPRRKLRPTFGFTVLLALVALLLVIAGGHGVERPAQATNEGDPAAMSLVIEGTFGGPVTCDSRDVAMCSLSDGSAFTVMIVPTMIPVGGYEFWQTLLDYGSLLYQQQPRPLDEISWDRSALPLRAPDPSNGTEGIIGHGDTSAFSSPFPSSRQKSVLVTLHFQCTSDDTLMIIPHDDVDRPDGTVYGRDLQDLVAPALVAMEINCSAPPTPTQTDTPGPPTSTPPPTDTPTQTATPKQCGDADGNGVLESLDSLRVLQFDAGLVPSVPSEGAADVNTDGRINSIDATLILQVVAGLSSGLTC